VQSSKKTDAESEEYDDVYYDYYEDYADNGDSVLSPSFSKTPRKNCDQN
jgi:hypothetical protein